MSLINDALKQAQRDMASRAAIAPPAIPPVQPPALARRKRRSALATAASVAGVLLLGVVAWYVRAPSPTSAQAVQRSVPAHPARPVEPFIAERSTARQDAPAPQPAYEDSPAGGPENTQEAIQEPAPTAGRLVANPANTVSNLLAFLKLPALAKPAVLPRPEQAEPAAPPSVLAAPLAVSPPTPSAAPERPGPTPASVAAPFDPSAYRLMGVLHGPSGPRAIINGRAVKIGDLLGQAVVVSIGQSAVEVELAGQRYTVGF